MRQLRTDLDVSQALTHLRSADAEMGRLIDGVGLFHLQLVDEPTTFASLAQAIVYQQLSPRAAATIFGRFCALFDGATSCPAPQQVLAAGDETLRGAGISGPKLRALRDLAERSLTGEVPTLEEARDMEDEAIVARLTEVRGIGRWTAEMFLIFTLGRPDVLPAADYGLRRGFQVAFATPALPSPAEVAERGARWAPYRSVASWYLWRALETPA